MAFDLGKAFEEAIFDKELLRDIADMTRQIIYDRVKIGKGIDSEENPSNLRSLKPLSRRYVEYRKKIVGKLGRFGSPGRSNLTLTGQMLESMVGKANKKGIIISIPKTRRRKLRPSDQSLTNDDVYEFVRKLRPFLALSKGETRIIEQEHLKRAERILKQKLKNF